jgi:hypothetical protein
MPNEKLKTLSSHILSQWVFMQKSEHSDAKSFNSRAMPFDMKGDNGMQKGIL